MGKLPEKPLVATVPSLKCLVKLTPPFEHQEQCNNHQNQGQQEH